MREKEGDSPHRVSYVCCAAILRPVQSLDKCQVSPDNNRQILLYSPHRVCSNGFRQCAEISKPSLASTTKRLNYLHGDDPTFSGRRQKCVNTQRSGNRCPACVTVSRTLQMNIQSKYKNGQFRAHGNGRCCANSLTLAGQPTE